jgi:hypothetical protein
LYLADGLNPRKAGRLLCNVPQFHGPDHHAGQKLGGRLRGEGIHGKGKRHGKKKDELRSRAHEDSRQKHCRVYSFETKAFPLLRKAFFFALTGDMLLGYVIWKGDRENGAIPLRDPPL